MRRYAKTIQTILEITGEQPLLLLQKLISVICYNLLNLLPPIATAGIVAEVTAGNFHGIWPYVFAYLAFYGLYFLALAWSMRSYTALDDYYSIYVQRRIFRHVADNDNILDQISHATISDTCSDDVQYIVDVIDDTCHAIAGLIQLAIIFVIFSYNSIFIALLALVIDLVYIILTNDNSHSVARAYEGTRKHNDTIINILNQMLTNLKQVKSLNVMANLSRKLSRSERGWSDQYRKKRQLLTIRECAIPLVLYGGKIIIYILLAYLVVSGQMTIDRLVLLVSYYELVMTCTDTILDRLLEVSTNGVRIKRIKAILDYAGDDNFDYGDLENDNIDGTVTFSGVYYSINHHPILQDISFKALPHEITTIVGRPGSGKTTIINLIYRLIRVKSGSILIDDESIYNYSKNIYTSNVSGVFQTPFTFKMSIRDNLSLTDSNIKHQVKACKRVGLDQAIRNLPNGYNTILDDAHPVLTAGQLQKLAIARALLTRAEILLFDDITSTVDPDSVKDIAALLTNLKDDHTIIVVTHQPELMKIADRVVVLKEGKISAKGANPAVLKRSALYRQLRQV